MAYDRISVRTANLIDVPPFEIVKVNTDFILNQEVIKKNIENVPLNLELLDSVLYEGILNPILTMKNWYPLAGSQRIRVVHEIKKRHNKSYNLEITVHRFLRDYHNVYYLWGEKEFRDKAIQLWFQLQELVFKSLYYEHDTDKGGTKMIEFEKIGDELEWKHDEPKHDMDTSDSDNHNNSTTTELNNESS